MEAANSVIELGKWGATGVAIGLIILTGGSIYAIWKIYLAFLDHLEKITTQNKEQINEITERFSTQLERSEAAIQENTKVMIGLGNLINESLKKH